VTVCPRGDRPGPLRTTYAAAGPRAPDAAAGDGGEDLEDWTSRPGRPRAAGNVAPSRTVLPYPS